MVGSDFTTSKATLNVQNNFITTSQFLTYLFLLDFGLIIAGCVLWRFFWYSINELKIWEIKRGYNINIGSQSVNSIVEAIKALHRIIKNLRSIDHNYVINVCGFEAYAYLYFLRIFTKVMVILAITDIFVWIPYQLFLNDLQNFSLATTDSALNYNFRTFYSLWTTFVVLYSIVEMKKFLRLMLKNYLFRGQKRLVNNLKTKTVLIRFSKGITLQPIQPIDLKTILVQHLKVQDTIVAYEKIPNYSLLLKIQYQFQIIKIVNQLGLQNFSSIWKLFKEIKEDPKQLMRKRIQQFKAQKRSLQRAAKPFINSYLVVFQSIETAESLVQQFEQTKYIYEGKHEQSAYISEVESHYVNSKIRDLQISVRWAQQPNDIRWICLTNQEKAQNFKYYSMNILSIILMVIGILVIVLSKSQEVIKIPQIILPFMLSIINVTLRFFISKSSEWQRRHFQYQWHMKEMKVLIIFFIISTVGGSLVRDTINLLDILTTGWGWLQLLGLIYKKPDGYFYYNFLANQLALIIFVQLFRLGDLFVELFHSRFTYLKNTRVRHKSKYGTNDPFRYGYLYASHILVFTIIFMYSASCPLIHLFGFCYFFVCLYSYGYSMVVFHKYEETCSNLRIFQQACKYIEIIMIGIISLIGITFMLQQKYANALIIYFTLGLLILYYLNKKNGQTTFLKDYITDSQNKRYEHLQKVIEQWRSQYKQSMKPIDFKNDPK